MAETAHDMFNRFVATLEKIERVPRERLLLYQTGLVERLAHHAHRNVPFYRDRLSRLFGHLGQFDFSRWHEVPLVTRDDASAHAAEMRAPNLPAAFGPIGQTYSSGSTGKPLTIAYNNLVRIATSAGMERMLRWWGADTSQSLARIKLYPNSEPPKYPDGRDLRGWSHSNPRSEIYELDLLTPIDQQLEWLLRKRPCYVMTSSSNAMALAYATTPEQSRELSIKLIFAIAETVLPRAREIVLERLNTEMAAIYSCEEIGIIATQCHANHGYHIVAENALVEVLREDGTPAAPGETGQVVVTGLSNYAMPFIRYAIGDVATVGPEHCTCGRSLALIAQVEGRTRHAFLFGDGTRIWPRLAQLDEIDKFVPNREMQIAQIDRERIEFRYVPADSDRPPDQAGLSAYLRSKLHPTVEIILVPMAAVPRGPAGKLDPIISMISE